jgi:gliding motility-associated-like protein
LPRPAACSACAVSDSIHLHIAYDDTQIDLPNAFTPGAAQNLEFKVLHLGRATLKRFRIYNRWGNMLFEAKDIAHGWDGNFNGEPQPAGVYVYEVEAITNLGRKVFLRKGM